MCFWIKTLYIFPYCNDNDIANKKLCAQIFPDTFHINEYNPKENGKIWKIVNVEQIELGKVCVFSQEIFLIGGYAFTFIGKILWLLIHFIIWKSQKENILWKSFFMLKKYDEKRRDREFFLLCKRVSS